MDVVEVGGLEIAFEGQGAGPPLVLLHGFVGHSREWRRQIDDLSDEFTVVAWDAPDASTTHNALNQALSITVRRRPAVSSTTTSFGSSPRKPQHLVVLTDRMSASPVRYHSGPCLDRIAAGRSLGPGCPAAIRRAGGFGRPFLRLTQRSRTASEPLPALSAVPPFNQPLAGVLGDP